ncbi:MAG TPA: alcohol dehydrogenase catalytic domain-containing protein [Terracidiphilus sp.]|nr:alcohol dehydrogenase catalytic domain-containing protein [Terracidiphilus sp.]
MKAIQMKQYGGPEQLEMVETPRPEPGAKQVLVRIAATSFNPVDPKRTSGVMRQIFPLQFPFTPGGDFSGVVEAVGREVSEFKAG